MLLTSRCVVLTLLLVLWLPRSLVQKVVTQTCNQASQEASSCPGCPLTTGCPTVLLWVPTTPIIIFEKRSLSYVITKDKTEQIKGIDNILIKLNYDYVVLPRNGKEKTIRTPSGGASKLVPCSRHERVRLTYSQPRQFGTTSAPGDQRR